jgi:hypothetical protein
MARFQRRLWNSRLVESNQMNQTKFKFIAEFSLESNLLKKLRARKADLIQSLLSKVGQFGSNWHVNPSKIKFWVYYVGKEHWAGLDVIHKLTNQPGRAMQLRISLENFSGDKATDFYDVFSVGSEVK